MTSSASNSEAGRPEMNRRDLTDIAMLADGSLPAGRREEVEARIAASPDASALLENERRAVDALRGVAAVRAPASLRERIATDRARAGRAPQRRRAVLGGAFACALAALVLALVLIAPGGGAGAPAFAQAASVALRGASSPGPPSGGGAPPGKLDQNVDEVYFPAALGNGVTATGQRVDQLGGRTARTVYYTTRSGTQIAYTIVSGPALAQPSGAARAVENGIWLRSIAMGHRVVVTWRRSGHTCILSASRVPDTRLLHLAAWEASA